jgi:signal transduction histidine kinase/CheY-like chemotaxis protein
MSVAPAPAPPRRSFRVRTLTVIVLVVAGAHVTALWVYLGSGVAPRARSIGAELTSVLDLLGELQARFQVIRSAVSLTQYPLDTDSAEIARRAAEIRTRMSGVGVRVAVTPFAGVPSTMRVPLARADDDLTRLQNTLLEFAALLELSRFGEVGRRRAEADSLMERLRSHLAEAQGAGLADLRERELALRGSAERAVRVLVIWFVSGLLLLIVVFRLILERVTRPLAELEAGLRLVADGDLATRVPVRRTDELGRLAGLFNETVRVLQNRAEQQGQFAAAGELIAGVAHEVNNPLMAVAAIAELQLGAEHLSADVREEFAQVGAQARRAGKLLAGLLRFVRPQGPVVGPVDVNAALDRAVDLLSFRLPVEQVEVERAFAADLPFAEGDPMRIEQVFVNLTSNALDALRDAPAPRRVQLRTWRGEDGVYAAVTDNGPGVATELRSRLFAPFVSSKGNSGTGLGLYISRQIVRGVGGDIEYQPAADGGSVFVVRLAPAAAPAAPVPQPRPAAPAAPAPRPAGLAGLTVLIVEDEVAIRRVLTRFLERRNASVTAAANGIEALECLKTLAPDLILMDLRMPVMSGAALYDVLRRERPELVDSTLVLSGDLSQLDELGGVGALPPDHIVAKPIALSDLETRIMGIVGRQV